MSFVRILAMSAWMFLFFCLASVIGGGKVNRAAGSPLAILGLEDVPESAVQETWSIPLDLKSDPWEELQNMSDRTISRWRLDRISCVKITSLLLDKEKMVVTFEGWKTHFHPLQPASGDLPEPVSDVDFVFGILDDEVQDDRGTSVVSIFRFDMRRNTAVLERAVQ